MIAPRRGPPLKTLRASDAGVSLREQVIQAAKAQRRPVLVVLSGDQMGTRRRVDDDTMLVGRDPDAGLVLGDALVSWHHARLEDRGDGFTLVDLGSTNGTTVNGAAGREFALAPGDKISFGLTVVRFEVQDAVDMAYDDELERRLNLDDLSGLYVRRRFDDELRAMVEAARASGGSVALLVMDLDGIKKINDTHGHLFGAYVIGESGHVIGRVLGDRGIGSRFGGDEFLAALPGLDVMAASAVGEEIRATIGAHPFEREGIPLRPGISIGVAAFPESAADASSLFQRADEALYRAKQAGKNRVCR